MGSPGGHDEAIRTTELALKYGYRHLDTVRLLLVVYQPFHRRLVNRPIYPARRRPAMVNASYPALSSVELTTTLYTSQ
jgi:hypothetical protein